jgi:glucose/arabinose dehydrogenase
LYHAAEDVSRQEIDWTDICSVYIFREVGMISMTKSQCGYCRLSFAQVWKDVTMPIQRWSAASSIAVLGLMTALAPSACAQVPLTPHTVQVPPSYQSAPFNTSRTLNTPSGFTPSVYARIGGARFLAVTPSGDLLVSQPGSGSVKIVRPNGTATPSVSDFVTGLNRPHDMVFHTIGATTYLYLSESNQIDRYVYVNGDTTAHGRQIVVANLPSASSPELHGAYAHELKNIAIDTNHKLYISIASATNADPSDTTATPKRAAIYQYNADGTGGRLFAQGLRNAEGLAIVPGTPSNLWVCVNNRDNIGYPFHNDWDSDGSDDYGKVMSSYVDNHPTEEFTHVRDGGNYGWPFANPNPDTASGVDNMPFDLDVQNNANGGHGAATSFDRISKGIQAHSAPLGLTFLVGTTFASQYRNSALIALHGSWNRTQKTGYKVIYFPWATATQTPGAQSDFVTGWLDSATQNAWGRPVDTAVDAAGNLFISDDASGTVYKLTYSTPAPLSLAPLADAVVRDGSFAARNFPATLLSAAGQMPVNYNTISYLKFNLTSVTGVVKSAILRLYGKHLGTGTASTAAYGVADTSWLESGLTWNNKPALGSLLATRTVTSSQQFYDWDVTAYVAARKSAGAAQVSLGLTQSARPADSWYDQFNPRESSTNPARLIVTSQ